MLNSARDVDVAAGTAVIPFHRGIAHSETVRLGVALLASVAFAALLVFLTGLWIGGWWLALFISALYGLALATGYVLAAFFVGHHGATRFGRGALHRFPSFLLKW